jgi:hypothetical protein
MTDQIKNEKIVKLTPEEANWLSEELSEALAYSDLEPKVVKIARSISDKLKDTPKKLVIVGHVGVGSTTLSASILAHMAGLEKDTVVVATEKDTAETLGIKHEPVTFPFPAPKIIPDEELAQIRINIDNDVFQNSRKRFQRNKYKRR